MGLVSVAAAVELESVVAVLYALTGVAVICIIGRCMCGCGMGGAEYCVLYMYCGGITSCCCPPPPYAMGALCVTLDGGNGCIVICGIGGSDCMDCIVGMGCCEWWNMRGCCIGSIWPAEGASGWEVASEKDEAESVEAAWPDMARGGSDITPWWW